MSIVAVLVSKIDSLEVQIDKSHKGIQVEPQHSYAAAASTPSPQSPSEPPITLKVRAPPTPVLLKDLQVYDNESASPMMPLILSTNTKHICTTERFSGLTTQQWIDICPPKSYVTQSMI